MRKLFLLFVVDYYIERIKSKYKADYEKLENDVKIKHDTPP